MGYGRWTEDCYVNYLSDTGRTTSTIAYTNTSGTTTTYTTIDSTLKHQDIYTAHMMCDEMNPFCVLRECKDTEEHPNTIPVILALDVTGSMGNGAKEVARLLNVVMSELYNSVKDVEFMVMAIGDLNYDRAPIQISQFESDVRVAQWVDKIYFEGGGGWNTDESYTAAWYMGLKHCDLDCWKRNKKGIIITLGDEPLNVYLPEGQLCKLTDDKLQGRSVDTKDLYPEAVKKFDIYHLAINDRSTSYHGYAEMIQESFGKYLDSDHLKVVTLDELTPTIISIVQNAKLDMDDEFPVKTKTQINEKGEITW